MYGSFQRSKMGKKSEFTNGSLEREKTGKNSEEEKEASFDSKGNVMLQN